MAAGATYIPIATTTTTGNATDCTFTSISSAYTDLILVFQGASSNSAGFSIQVGNGSLDTNSNYSTTSFWGTGSSASVYRRSDETYARTFEGTDSGTGQINCIFQFQNYSNTSTYKTFLTRYNSASNGTGETVSLWRSTSAINQIKIYKPSGNFVNNSTFTLYGIAAA